ncbi:polysaccharide pyruvyl transferase family protein [Roseovarius albus]|nr:polysaccharide pyruvyl transferase family protein [Roseovarius albus]
MNYRYPNRIFRYLQRAGVYNDRNLFWSFYEPRNFGDWIGPYLFEAYTGRLPMHYVPNLGGRSTAVYAAGSILRNVERPDRATIWGSGIIHSADTFPRPKEVLAVRGPRSNARLSELGYETAAVHGDPGILLPLLYHPRVRKSFRVGLIPHYDDYDLMRSAYSGMPDLQIVDVRKDVESVINQITACEMTLSSSLHGIILSHSYGVPCCWIDSWHGLIGDGVKFLDYFEAAAIFGVRPQALPKSAEIAELESMVRDSDMAELAPLQGPLRAVCPFASLGPNREK